MSAHPSQTVAERSDADVLLDLTGQGRIQQVVLDDLHIDEAYQRDLSRELVERIKSKWDLAAAGYIVVSRRANGDLYIVNGQHRAAAAKELGETLMVAQVVVGLDRAQEAELRLMGNTARTDSSQERFRAQVAAGHPESIAIQQIASEFGTRINPTVDSRAGINSVSAVEKLYRLDKGKTLTSVFEVVQDAFGSVGGKAAGVAMLNAIAFILTRHPDALDRPRFIQRLEAQGVDAIDRSARNFKAASGGPLWLNYYRAFIEAYNYRLSETQRIVPRSGGWSTAGLEPQSPATRASIEGPFKSRDGSDD